MNNLINFLSNFQDLGESEIQEFASLTSLVRYKKNEIIIKSGEIVSKIGFVESGILRSFFIKDGSEITQDFFTEKDILALMRSFLHQQPSVMSYQALQESTIYYISYESLQMMYTKSEKFLNLGRKILEHLLILYEDRVSRMLTMNPEERFLNLVQTMPTIVNSANQKYIASFLGITPESLSRIKARGFK
ncbi:MAG: Crp/Fnr family transcriptional regulator [Leptospiraceae bacterium]|nr:Crp/Fnr family transcriptional regulator [Leptospiraceae bacterium]